MHRRASADSRGCDRGLLRRRRRSYANTDGNDRVRDRRVCGRYAGADAVWNELPDVDRDASPDVYPQSEPNRLRLSNAVTVAESHRNPFPDPAFHCVPDSVPDRHGNSDSDRNSDDTADRDCHSISHRNADDTADSDGHAVLDCNVDRVSDGNGHTIPDRDSHAIPDRHSHAVAYSVSYTITDAVPDPEPHADSDAKQLGAKWGPPSPAG